MFLTNLRPTLFKELSMVMLGLADDEAYPQSLLHAWLTEGRLSLPRAAGHQ